MLDSHARAAQPLAADLFAPLRRASPDTAFVVAQIGQSLDGRVATVSGDSRYINGPAALDHLHRLRAHVEAVVVGAETILADDPQLTVRRVAGVSPARVVIDPHGRTGAARKWLAEDGVRRLVVTAEGVAAPDGAECLALPCDQGRIAPAALVAALFARGFRRILVEGGPRTIAAFIEARCLDRLHALVAPVIIGSGRPGFQLPVEPILSRALKPKATPHLLGDGEVLFDCDFSAYRRR
ncbi:riboflavin-specific deaminase-like protein [Rhodoblastus acidophilus]|uniref:RibD family protein n=1 Tax=Rhodoblastus acidophilus TaxID=1074 RepID=UPI0022253DC1|nr:RibD family protein [Rhodoblastus acidophilus]MCW2316980.1 riboflavin-specific deaminase-like protein [Rhodoblastus acidophilus]